MGYIERLIKNCEMAKKSEPVNIFELDSLSQLDGISQAIYIIEEVDGNNENTFIDFSRYKDKKERSCSKLNAPSNIMYVGSSTTGVKKRIAHHLGEGHKGTYSLHLKYWFQGKKKITIKEYNETRDVLQIIEDDLSDRLNPAFGKRGGNNK